MKSLCNQSALYAEWKTGEEILRIVMSEQEDGSMKDSKTATNWEEKGRIYNRKK
jgi:hypothetical protein